MRTTIASWLVAAIALTTLGGWTYKKTTTPPEQSAYFKQEKAAINGDLWRIEQRQQQVEKLQQQCRTERQQGIKGTATRANLVKAKADLQREKTYLKADKAELLAAHRSHITEHRSQVKSNQSNIRQLRAQTNRDISKGKVSAVLHAQKAVNQKQALLKKQEALKEAKTSRNADLLAINHQIKQAEAQPGFVIAIENSFAKTQNLALK